MKDISGKNVRTGDLVYFRKQQTFPFIQIYVAFEIKKYITLNSVYVVNIDNSIDVCVSPENIKKLSNSEAMLWKLENL